MHYLLDVVADRLFLKAEIAAQRKNDGLTYLFLLNSISLALSLITKKENQGDEKSCRFMCNDIAVIANNCSGAGSRLL
jgi:hypothetical protein